MGQSPSSVRRKSSRQRSFRGFARRSKLNKSSLSHTFSLPTSEEYPELMNVNAATEEQLMTLPGVNRQLARTIVMHRQMIGRFKRVDDLALVSGIGAEKLELLRPEICVSTKKPISRASSCTHSLDSIRLAENKLCSVNSSSVFQLQCVPGLNQELAANIVDYRNKKGPFKSLDDLIKVRGIDIIRLSTVKPYLSLEPRKCESLQYLANGHTNGWANHSLVESVVSKMSSPARSPHRKSLSMPTNLLVTLPNGFAAAPVNDILDLLAAYSHRPVVEENFIYERNGVKCCRVASWNLHKLSIEKITNPGVREVMCRTILENKFSLIAVQDILDEAALRVVQEELNSPTLRRVREWKCNSHKWEYCISKQKDGRNLGLLYDSLNKNGTIEDIELDQVCLLTEDGKLRRLINQITELQGDNFSMFARAFLFNNRPVILMNLECTDQLSEKDSKRLSEMADLASRTSVQTIILGEFSSLDNVSSISACESLLDSEISTTVDPKTTGRSCILCPGIKDKSHFNGRSGIVKSGLSHLAIPRGWSWGGPASPFCPIWAELNVPD